MLFIHDIVNIFSDGSCVCKLLADDVKIYATFDITDDTVNMCDKLKTLEK